MSVVGFDIGNQNCVIAASSNHDSNIINVLLNNNEAVVSFVGNQRVFKSTSTPKSTISQVKRLVGKQFQHLKKELTLLPFATREGPHGGILIEVVYLKLKWTFTPVEILAMLFTHLKNVAEKELDNDTRVVECVIAIPAYFTDLQRRLYLDAAGMAGLKPLRLMHDGTAVALSYGMYKTDLLDDDDDVVVVFVDIGHCDTQVTVAAFEQGGLRILAHSFDQDLGGRDFDEVLYAHFAAEFNKNYKVDVCGDARACVRLRAACEKVKKVLSANTEAPISIERLVGDMDVSGFVTREEFENLSAKLLEKVTFVCGMALEDSGLSVDEIHAVELVGSGSRIPAITRVLTSFFKKEPTRTLIANECVARGCALCCAMLSPTSQFRDYEVEDSCPYSIVLPVSNYELEFFSKGSSFPSKVMHTYTGNTPFFFQLAYNKHTDFPAGISPIVGRFRIGPSQHSDGNYMKVEVCVLFNDNGIVEIDHAKILEDGTYPRKSKGNMRILNLPFSENLEVSTTHHELREALLNEKILAQQDLKVEQIKDQKNTLESFVYDTRSKLSSDYKRFVTNSEKEVIMNSLKETEDWLYEDSYDESQEDYTGKLRVLKKLLEPIENKYQENKKAKAEKTLQACAGRHRLLANPLSASKKQKVRKTTKQRRQEATYQNY